jgi:hypothetical protein
LFGHSYEIRFFNHVKLLCEWVELSCQSRTGLSLSRDP